MEGRERDVIRAAIVGLSRGILQDAEHIASNVKQAYNLFGWADLDLESFMACVKEAHSVTLRALPRLRRPGAYFFKVLGDVLLRDSIIAHNGKSPDGAYVAGLTAAQAGGGDGSPKDVSGQGGAA